MPTVNIAPRTEMLRGMRNADLSLKIASSEIFDNSFDADAKKVLVTTTADQLIVEDDGHGIMDIRSIFRVGDHDSNRRTIGRYGHGFKDAALWLADILEVDSFNGRSRLRARVDWKKMEVSNDWDMDFTEDSMPAGTPTYTRLTFSKLVSRRRLYPGWDEDIGDDLAYEFLPGLRSGFSIIIDGHSLVSPPAPELTDEIRIDDCFEGRHFRLRAGIKTDMKQSQRYGYDVAYMHRLVLQHDTRRAFGDYNAMRFYGYLELLDDGEEAWTLSKNKRGFEERADLYQYLLPQVEALLQRSEQISEDIKFRNLSGELSMVFSAALQKSMKKVREKRLGPLNETGQVAGTGLGSPRRRARRVTLDHGSVEVEQVTSIKVVFDCEDPAIIGTVDEGDTSAIVHLNRSWPNFDWQNRQQVYSVVIFLFLNYFLHNEGNPQRTLAFPDKDLGETMTLRFSEMLRNVVMAEQEISVEA
jgi:histidine kinase/DNA gyrase B/HSP90-like ATPase